MANEATTYSLRDVPIAIWRAARARAIQEGRSIRDVLIEFLKTYGKGGK